VGGKKNNNENNKNKYQSEEHKRRTNGIKTPAKTKRLRPKQKARENQRKQESTQQQKPIMNWKQKSHRRIPHQQAATRNHNPTTQKKEATEQE
jgi:hypothetical protein